MLLSTKDIATLRVALLSTKHYNQNILSTEGSNTIRIVINGLLLMGDFFLLSTEDSNFLS